MPVAEKDGDRQIEVGRCGVERLRQKERRLPSLIGWIFVAGRKNHEDSLCIEGEKKRQTAAVCFGFILTAAL